MYHPATTDEEHHGRGSWWADRPSGRPRHRCLYGGFVVERESMSENKLNISRQTNALLRALDLAPPDVRRITITPSQVEAEVYLRNDKGEKYVTPVDENGYTTDVSDVATETRTYEVRT
jgi:hypothetical protein